MKSAAATTPGTRSRSLDRRMPAGARRPDGPPGGRYRRFSTGAANPSVPGLMLVTLFHGSTRASPRAVRLGPLPPSAPRPATGERFAARSSTRRWSGHIPEIAKATRSASATRWAPLCSGCRAPGRKSYVWSSQRSSRANGSLRHSGMSPGPSPRGRSAAKRSAVAGEERRGKRAQT